MNSSLVKGIAIGVVVATTGGAIAGYRTFVAPAVPTHAQVLNVVAVTETVTKPREVCETIEVTLIFHFQLLRSRQTLRHS